MSPILERVQEFLTAHELTAHPHGDGEALVVLITLTHCRCSVMFHHEHGSDELTLWALHPANVPADRRFAVAEFLMRLNWNLHRGQRFLLDWGDGEVRLRRYVPLQGLPEVKTVAIWFLSVYVLINSFHPALMNVIYRGMPPVQALEQGEADFEALIKTHKDNDRNEV
ncbi:MAG: YbjN domain-containing protein [Acidimicrobiia bacterium]|nr:YbjN domain-containing protein [Acidimicrobiia bacterium]